MLWCYLQSYAQQSVDRSGEVAVDNGWRPGREAPRPGVWRGAAVAVLNTYKKNFLKKF